MLVIGAMLIFAEVGVLQEGKRECKGPVVDATGVPLVRKPCFVIELELCSRHRGERWA